MAQVPIAHRTTPAEELRTSSCPSGSSALPFLFLCLCLPFLSPSLFPAAGFAQGHGVASHDEQNSHCATTRAHPAAAFTHRAAKRRQRKRAQFPAPTRHSPATAPPEKTLLHRPQLGVTKCCACQQNRTRRMRSPAPVTHRTRTAYSYLSLPYSLQLAFPSVTYPLQLPVLQLPIPYSCLSLPFPSRYSSPAGKCSVIRKYVPKLSKIL